jgi:MFS family permease
MLKNTIAFIKTTPVFAVGFLFASASLMLGIWVAALPAIKERLHFSDSQLGLSLLLAPLGALTGVYLSTKLLSKIEVGRWLFAGSILFCFIIIMEVTAQSRIVFWTALYLHGINGFLNGVSVNAVVDLLEKKYNRRFMASSHAMYSIGGGVGAGIAAVLFVININSYYQSLIMAAAVILILLFFRKYLLAHKIIIDSGSSLQMPSASILGISFICLVVFMAEGCVADWSAIYLKESLLSSPEIISLGFAGFSVAMTIGRLNGDELIPKTGSKRIVIAGSLLAAFGFLIVAVSLNTLMAIGGFVLVGFGCSCIVPVLFSASANIPGVSAVQGFAMVTTGGLIGFLAGPSLIGFVSEILSLSTGFAFVFLLLLLAAFTGWQNKYLQNKKETITDVNYTEQFL